MSMLTQMLHDDKDEEVREAVVKSLGLLTGFICDTDKFAQVRVCYGCSKKVLSGIRNLKKKEQYLRKV